MLLWILSHRKRQDPNLLQPILPLTTSKRTCPFAFTQDYDNCIKDCNDFSQDFYDSVVKNIQLHMVECPCGKSGCQILYGHYGRKVKFMSELVTLLIQRVFCKECLHTHALLLSGMVPYSQVPLEDQQEIIDCCEDQRPVEHVLQRNYLIDESNVKHVIRQYRRHWKQRLASIGATIKDALPVPCLSAYLRQFMQIHSTRNILFSPTNTT